MDKEKYYKYMFFGGANYNIGAALLVGILPIFVDGFLPVFGIENPPSLIFLHMLAILVLTFAISYLYAMNNLPKSKIIGLTGASGRLLVFLIVVIYTIVGDCSWAFLLLVSPDLILGIMYLEYFLNYKEQVG